MNHGSLFSGIGGFDLAAEWMGWNNVFHCEINPFGQKILKYYWSNAISYDDITKTDFTIHRGNIDILTGGFPCQPFSIAGKRKGTEDPRNLWPEYYRAIREIQPTYVVGENVPGLINWSGGMVFEQVQADLEAEGYEVAPVILPACSVNAPHKRERIWFVAYSDLYRHKFGRFKQNRSAQRESKSEKNQRQRVWYDSRRISKQRNAPNSENIGLQLSGNTRKWGAGFENHCFINAPNANSRRQSSEKYRQKESGRVAEKSFRNNWQNFPTQSPVCSGDDGLSSRSHTETFYETDDMDRDYIIQNAVKEGKIEVDFDSGKIYSRRIRGHEGKRKLLKGADCNGYMVHNISFNGIKKSCRAHQIVWIAANGLYDREKYVIDHKNRDKADNRLDNLRLATPSQNRRNAYDYTGQFSPEEKEIIAVLYHDSDMSMRELAEELNISKSRVGQIVQEQKLLDGITFPKWRNESIKAYGNAIVPQVVYQIFKVIEETQ